MAITKDISPTLATTHYGEPAVLDRRVVVLDHHPQDSRIKVKPDEVCGALNERMGTGGNNVPLVMIHEDIHGE